MVFDEKMWARPIIEDDAATRRAKNDIVNIHRRRNGKMRCPNCGDWGLSFGEDTHGKYMRCSVCKFVSPRD